MAADSKRVVSKRAKWVELVEAIHDVESDDERWSAQIRDAALGVLPTANVAMYSVCYEPDLSSVVPIFVRPAGLLAPLRAAADLANAGAMRYFEAAHFGPPVHTRRDFDRTVSRELADVHRAIDTSFAVGDAVAMVTHPEPGLVTVLVGSYDDTVSLGAYERSLLTRIAFHLEGAGRLRRRPESVQAEVTASGRVVRHRPDAMSRDVLGAHAGRVRQARSRALRESREGLLLWAALLGGRASLVPRPNGGYFVLDNPPAAHALRALTPIEMALLSLAARGLSAKLVAYALGVTPSAVSNGLARAAAKLGTASRTDLLRVAALLARDPRAELATDALTAAERDVLELVQRGLSNAQIASRRSRSIRTIANQVASLLRKTKSPSRRALIASVPRKTA